MDQSESLDVSSFPAPLPHGPIEETLPDIFTVTGSALLGPGVMITRVMTIVRNYRGELTLINAVRLGEQALNELDALGPVRHVMRIGHHHLSDDPFYVHRYGARMWALAGHSHRHGLRADVLMDQESRLPFRARLIPIEGPVAEALLLIPTTRGTLLLSADLFQNIVSLRGCSPLGALATWLLGFYRPAAIGKGFVAVWQQQHTTETSFRSLADQLVEIVRDHPFKYLISAHGEPIIDGSAQHLVTRSVAAFVRSGGRLRLIDASVLARLLFVVLTLVIFVYSLFSAYLVLVAPDA